MQPTLKIGQIVKCLRYEITYNHSRAVKEPTGRIIGVWEDSATVEFPEAVEYPDGLRVRFPLWQLQVESEG